MVPLSTEYLYSYACTVRTVRIVSLYMYSYIVLSTSIYLYLYVRRQGCDWQVANGGTRSSKVCASLQKILSRRISWRPKLCYSVVDVTSRVDCMRQMSWARLAKCVTWAIFVLILYEASTYILDYYLLPLKIMGSKWIEQMVPLDVYLRICCNE